jgi:hypothetical protein
MGVVALVGAAACKGDGRSRPAPADVRSDATTDATTDTPMNATIDAPTATVDAAAASWREAFDLDGDGHNDRIVVEFTGGAHCCYRLGASLSSTNKSTRFPFEMDGGYVGGLDLSQPDRFTVRTRAGSLPELVYEIAVENGEPQPIDPAWTRTWGVRSHRVALCFAGGTPRASDDAPDLPPCR